MDRTLAPVCGCKAWRVALKHHHSPHDREKQDMFRITSQTKDGRKGGTWRVLDGDDHTPTKLDNPNLFFSTKREAASKCRELNR